MGKYLKFYEECMESGKLPKRGLCDSVGARQVKLFKPTKEEYGLRDDHFDHFDIDDFFWGFDGDYRSIVPFVNDIARDFTPLRQNIVLFMAAINREL